MAHVFRRGGAKITNVRDRVAHHFKRGSAIHTAASILTLTLPCSAAAPAPPVKWWNDDWPYRAKIECPAGAGDVAYAELPLAGKTTPDGRDLRLIGANHRPGPFVVLHHDAQRTTLIQFPVAPGKERTCWLYYGNLDARPIETRRRPGVSRRQATQVRNEWRKQQALRKRLLGTQAKGQAQLEQWQRMEKAGKASGQAKPEDLKTLRQAIETLEKQLAQLRIPLETPEPEDPTQWYAHRGVVLRIYRKARHGHPQTFTDLETLITQSKLEGAGFRERIGDGYNPFGSSDHYVSFYEGYLRIDEPGEYAFSTSSDEGSWVVVNHRLLVEWPGPHDWGGSGHGQHHGRVMLDKGVARIRYYHEEGEGRQLAYLGWKPPGSDHFIAIPDDRWLAARQAHAADVQARDAPLVAIPDIHVLHTYWVRDSQNQQVTLVRFRDRSRSTAGVVRKVHWAFGDGLEGDGRDVQHVYFTLGRPEVTLTVSDAAGNQDTLTCSPNLFHVDVTAPGLRRGKAEQYIKAADGYDVDHMDRDDLLAYADFWRLLEQWPQHVRAANGFTRRFDDDPVTPRLAAEAAASCTQPNAYQPARAEELLKLALAKTEDPAARAELELTLAHLLAWDLADYPRAETLYRQVHDRTRAAKGRQAKNRTRRSLIGLGDVALLSADDLRAARHYRDAQDMGKTMDLPEELAKTGSYPYTVDDLLARGEYDWALRTIDEWEDRLPLQKLTGYSFFLRGKVLFVQQPSKPALRFLELAEQVARRAVHVPEAVWLRANCLLALGRPDQALEMFRRIRIDFTHSEFHDRAASKIEQCEKLLKDPTADAKRN